MIKEPARIVLSVLANPFGWAESARRQAAVVLDRVARIMLRARAVCGSMVNGFLIILIR